MNIVNAKRELYDQLKSDNNVVGAGVKGNGKTEHIVIFVKNLSSQISSPIPATFKGIKVKTEQQKTAKLM